MRLRCSMVGQSSPAAALLQLTVSANLTKQVDPGTVYNFGSTINPAQYTNVASPLSVYSWALFPQPLLNPLIVFPTQLELLNADTAVLTATGKMYLMTAAWDPAALTWNNQPAFPTDTTLIAVARIQPGIAAPAPRSQATAQVNFTFDLSGKAVTVYGVAWACQVDQAVTGAGNEADLNTAARSTVPVIQQQSALQTMGVTNRACDGANNITLTTAAPHNLKPNAQIQISGVGAGYDTTDATYGTPYYVSCVSGTAGTTIKYTLTNAVAENVASAGSILFPPTGM